MAKYDSDIIQLALNFPHRPSLGREDFLVSPCNQDAVTMVEGWPMWPYFALCIYGAAGCGKTHLANVWANQIANMTNYPYRIPFIRAEKLTIERSHKLFEQHHCLVIENLQDLKNEEALFHLYNMYRDEGGNILFTSEYAPARLNIKLPDLRSRLNIVPSLEISEPDDRLLSALLLKLFTDRQIMPSPELIDYMLNNMQRSFDFARKLVAEIDNISLARKTSVNLAVVKEALSYLNKDSLQGELF